MNAALQYQDAFTTPSLEDLQPLDIGLDESELKELAHILQVLHQYTVSFNDQRAVCQAQVKQLIEECDIALDKRYPLQSFTQAPSGQNLSVVTEGVLQRIGTAFAEFWKKFLELVKKIFSWIINAAKRLVHREQTVMHQVVVIRAMREATQEVKDIKGGTKRDEGEFTGTLEQAVKLYQSQLTAMGLEMLQQGPYVAAVKALALSVNNIVKMLGTKFAEIERRINTHNQSRENPTQENFIGLADPIPVPQVLETAFKRWLQPANMIDAWIDVMDIFHTAATQLYTDKPSGAMEWEIAAKVIISPKSGLAEPMIPIPDGIVDYVNDMGKIVDQARAHPITQSLEGRDAHQAEEALDSYMEDVRALLQYMEVANMTLDTQYHLVDSVAKCAKAEFDLECAEHAVDADAVKTIRSIREKLALKIVARR
jgi:hypothetical protein